MTHPGGRENERGALALQVDRDNVLQARALLLREADRLDKVLLRVRAAAADHARCGDDPVSADAALAFPERIAALTDGCQAHNDELRAAALRLEAVARTYGYTEAEIVGAVPAMGPVAVALTVREIVERAL